jgi:hypothetical protein
MSEKKMKVEYDLAQLATTEEHSDTSSSKEDTGHIDKVLSDIFKNNFDVLRSCDYYDLDIMTSDFKLDVDKYTSDNKIIMVTNLWFLNVMMLETSESVLLKVIEIILNLTGFLESTNLMKKMDQKTPMLTYQASFLVQSSLSFFDEFKLKTIDEDLAALAKRISKHELFLILQSNFQLRPIKTLTIKQIHNPRQEKLYLKVNDHFRDVFVILRLMYNNVNQLIMRLHLRLRFFFEVT